MKTSDDDEDDDNGKKELKRAKHLQLPFHSDFASSHVLINRYRLRKRILPLYRVKELDEEARTHAETMAKSRKLRHRR